MNFLPARIPPEALPDLAPLAAIYDDELPPFDLGEPDPPNHEEPPAD